jgi:hypothetical protein
VRPRRLASPPHPLPPPPGRPTAAGPPARSGGDGSPTSNPEPLTLNPNPNPKLAGVGEEGEFREEKIRVRSWSKSHRRPISLPYSISYFLPVLRIEWSAASRHSLRSQTSSAFRLLETLSISPAVVNPQPLAPFAATDRSIGMPQCGRRRNPYYSWQPLLANRSWWAMDSSVMAGTFYSWGEMVAFHLPGWVSK